MSTVRIRDAALEDAERILEIYTYYVENTAIASRPVNGLQKLLFADASAAGVTLAMDSPGAGAK